MGRIMWIGLRVTVWVALLLTAYYLLPVDRVSAALAVTLLVLGLVAFFALVAFQVVLIIRSQHPGLRAAEALGLTVPLFLLLFASAYVRLAATTPGDFGGPLSHTDALYFCVTVFATVGFGDITPKSETARLVVTGQMIMDLIVLGLLVKVIVGAAQKGVERRAAADTDPSE